MLIVPQLISKCTAKIQADFIQWFDALHSRSAEKLCAMAAHSSAYAADCLSAAATREAKTFTALVMTDEDDINEDIAAYERAKEQLIKNSSRKNGI